MLKNSLFFLAGAATTIVTSILVTKFWLKDEEINEAIAFFRN